MKPPPMTVTRLALLFLLFNALGVGAWALFMPSSFYGSFPANGWTWVSVDGPYNEHLIRDVGGLNLAIAVLITFALFKPTSTLLRATALATLAFQLPHTVYHLTHLGLIPTTLQQILQASGLSLGVVASLLIFSGVRKTSPLERVRKDGSLRLRR